MQIRIHQLFISLIIFFVSFSFAQEYPNKPIRIVTGSSPDFPVRIFGKKITESLGQQIISEQIPTASGKIAAEAVAKSKPDGYTFLNAVPSLIINDAVQGRGPNLSKDFLPVAITNVLPFVLVVSKELQVKSVEELISILKSNPAKYHYGATNGTFPHLAIELFKIMTKTEVVHVPYKNTTDTVMGLLSGQVQITVIPYGSVASLHQSNKLGVLAITSGNRSKILPDIPTLSESGLPGYDLIGWNGFLAPLKTPNEIIQRLNSIVLKSNKDSEVIKQLSVIGNEVGPDFSPEQFGDFIKKEVIKWEKLVKDTGIKLD